MCVCGCFYSIFNRLTEIGMTHSRREKSVHLSEPKKEERRYAEKASSANAMNGITLWSHSVTYVRHHDVLFYLSLYHFRNAWNGKAFFVADVCVSLQTSGEEQKNNILFTISCYLHKLGDQLGITYTTSIIMIFSLCFFLSPPNGNKCV